jgi:phage-related baseplate assembly protein
LVARVTEDINGYYQTDGTAVPGWKAAGVHVVVAAATEVSVAVTGVITMSPGAAKPPALILAANAVSLYIKSLSLGSKVVLSELVAIIMAIDGVYNVALSAPTADTTIGASSKAMPGTISLT